MLFFTDIPSHAQRAKAKRTPFHRAVTEPVSGAEWTEVSRQLPGTSTDLICHAHNPSIKKNTHAYFKDGSCLIMHFCSVQTDEKRKEITSFTWHLKTADSPAGVHRRFGVTWHFRKQRICLSCCFRQSHRVGLGLGLRVNDSKIFYIFIHTVI